MPWTLIPARALIPQPWRNGHGTSHEIAACPGQWTVSLATLERDAPFSHYPGMDRIFTPIAGDPPPELAIDGRPFAPCPLLAPCRFPGDVPVHSRIPAPGRAFNVIVARHRWLADVTLVETPATVAPRAPIVFLHCLNGTVGHARPADTIRHDGPPADPVHLTGTALLVELHPR